MPQSFLIRFLGSWTTCTSSPQVYNVPSLIRRCICQLLLLTAKLVGRFRDSKTPSIMSEMADCWRESLHSSALWLFIRLLCWQPLLPCKNLGQKYASRLRRKRRDAGHPPPRDEPAGWYRSQAPVWEQAQGENA